MDGISYVFARRSELAFDIVDVVALCVVVHLREHPQNRETVIINCRTDDRIDIVGEINIVNLSYYDIAQYNVDEFGLGSIIVEQDDTTIHLVYIQEFKEWLAI